MNSETKATIATVLCVGMICGTIVGWAYIAYNPKDCPTPIPPATWYKAE